MRPTTKTALALAGMALALPAAAAAEIAAPEPKDPTLAASLAGPVTAGQHRDRIREIRRERRARVERRERRAALRADTTAAPHLEAIAACESGGDPGAVDASGTYRGKYQFDMQTWASVGGSGDPAAAPEAEQDKRAAMLYAQAGATPWPVCGN